MNNDKEKRPAEQVEKHHSSRKPDLPFVDEKDLSSKNEEQQKNVYAVRRANSFFNARTILIIVVLGFLACAGLLSLRYLRRIYINHTNVSKVEYSTQQKEEIAVGNKIISDENAVESVSVGKYTYNEDQSTTAAETTAATTVPETETETETQTEKAPENEAPELEAPTTNNEASAVQPGNTGGSSILYLSPGQSVQVVSSAQVAYCTFKSSNENVAVVNNGVVTAVSTGAALVTVKSQSFQNTLKVVVR